MQLDEWSEHRRRERNALIMRAAMWGLAALGAASAGWMLFGEAFCARACGG